MQTYPDLLDPAAAEREYPIFNTRRLRHLRATGRMPYYLVGGKVHYAREDLEAFLAGCRVEARRRPR